MPHHGSRYSSPTFLSAVAPRVVLVSVGAGNTYGQPNLDPPEVLERAGAAVRRTDTSGDVAVTGTESVAGGRAELQVVARGSPTPARRRRRRGPRAGSYRRRDSNPHCRPPKDRVSCQLDYAGNPARIRTPARLRRTGPCGASPHARWRARCTAPPRSSRPGRSRRSSGSHRSRSCRTSASRRRRPRR